MVKVNRRIIIRVCLLIFIGFVASGTLARFSSFTPLQSLRFVFGYPLILFLPGFVWTYALLGRKSVSKIERLVLSIAFSIAIVPLVVSVGRKIGMATNPLSILFEMVIIMAAGYTIFFFRERHGAGTAPHLRPAK